MAETVTHGQTAYIRKAIRTKLLTYTSNVYYLKAKDTADTFAVFLLGSILKGEVIDQASLEVSLSGRGDNSATIEDLASTIFAGLDHYFYSDSDVSFEVYAENIIPVKNEDETIITRRLSFTLRVYGG